MANRTRDLDIFRAWINGKSVYDIAAEYEISPSRVYAITARIRNEMKASTTAGHLRDDLTDQLNEMRSLAAEVARDYNQDTADRLKAVRSVVAVAARLAGMHGLDTTRIESTQHVTYEIQGVDPDAV